MLPVLPCLLALSVPVWKQISVAAPTDPDIRGTLTGVVLGGDETPVVGARVLLRTRTLHGSTASRSTTLGQGLTRDDGRFVLCLAHGPGEGREAGTFLEVAADGFAPTHLEGVPLPPPSYDLGPIHLSPPVELRGRVVGPDGPVVGAEVQGVLGPAGAPDPDHVGQPAIAVTDAHGEFLCRVLPPGRVTLGVRAAGFADRVLEPCWLRADEPNRVDFQLEPERIVRLEVRSEAGLPLPEARVEFLGERFDERPWDRPDLPCAFWRGPEHADASGRITLRGLARGFAGEVRLVAPDHRAERVALTEDSIGKALQPVTWIEVRATRQGGGPPPEIIQLEVRDLTHPPSWCGNCDQGNWATVELDSPAVEVLGPDRWRVAWNGQGAYAQGGWPGEVRVRVRGGAFGVAGVRARAQEPDLECRVDLEAPARLVGIVRTTSGEPVSVRLRAMSQWGLVVTSDARGRFELTDLRAGRPYLEVLDGRWVLSSGHAGLECLAGETKEVALFVRPRRVPAGVRGVLRIDGAVPPEPILLALDELDQHLPRAQPRGLAWTDATGHFEIGAPWPREYHLVPKQGPPSNQGGWRDFAAEFPAHGANWPWKVRVRATGTEEVEIDLARQ